MIVVIGANPYISEELVDLLPETSKTAKITIDLELETNELEVIQQLSEAELILLNMDRIYKKGLSLIKTIQVLLPTVHILALDDHNSKVMAKHIIQQGASAYIPLNTNKKQLLEALQATLMGNVFIGS